MELLHGDGVAVHEQVQQVDGQVSGCRTQPEVVAHNGHQVGKVSSQAELRRLSFVRRQLQLLEGNMCLNMVTQNISCLLAKPRRFLFIPGVFVSRISPSYQHASIFIHFGRSEDVTWRLTITFVNR